MIALSVRFLSESFYTEDYTTLELALRQTITLCVAVMRFHQRHVGRIVAKVGAVTGNIP